MTNYEAVIFDMDGVLVDSEDLIKECETYVLEEGEGVEVTEQDVEEHEGMATQEYFKKMIREKGSTDYSEQELDERTKEMEERKLELYFENMDKIDVIEEAAETVRTLSKDFKVAVASNSERKMVKNVVEYLEIEEDIDTYSSFTDVENGKPEPDVFDHAAEEMGVSSDEAVVLEDSEAGTQAAVNGGYTTYRFRREPMEGVKGTVDSMEEFRDIPELS